MSKQQVQLKEKELTVNDLKDTDHVGFVCGKEKWEIVYTYDGYHALTDDKGRSDKCTWIYNYGAKSIKELLSVVMHLQEVYRFDTRKELYQWLAEG